MKYLSYGCRFAANFALLSMAYFSLNFVEAYNQRFILAMLFLVYVAVRATFTARAFQFFRAIERLEIEAGRLAGLLPSGYSLPEARRAVVTEVEGQREDGEMKSYIDLLFLVLVAALCITKVLID